MRARGHEVIGVCADGPLLAKPRAEGFGSRRWGWNAAFRCWRIGAHSAPWCGCFVPRGRTWCTRTCRSAGFWRGWRHGGLGVPRIAYTGHGFWFNFPGSWPRSALSASRWSGWRPRHRHLLDRQRSRGAGREAVAYPPRRRRDRQRPRSGALPPRPGRRVSGSALGLGVPDGQVVVLAVPRLVWHKGYPELAAAMRDVPGAGAVGRRRAPDLRSRRRHGRPAAERRSGLTGFACSATVTTCPT